MPLKHSALRIRWVNNLIVVMNDLTHNELQCCQCCAGVQETTRHPDIAARWDQRHRRSCYKVRQHVNIVVVVMVVVVAIVTVTVTVTVIITTIA